MLIGYNPEKITIGHDYKKKVIQIENDIKTVKIIKRLLLSRFKRKSHFPL